MTGVQHGRAKRQRSTNIGLHSVELFVVAGASAQKKSQSRYQSHGHD